MWHVLYIGCFPNGHDKVTNTVRDRDYLNCGVR